MKQYEKAPSERLDYEFSWLKELGTDTIDTSVWTATPDDLVIVTSSNTTTTARVRVAGGTLGQRYLLTNQVTTAGGQIEERSMVLQVMGR